MSGVLLRNWQIVLALVLLFVEGICNAQGETYLWWYLEELGAGPAMIYTVSFTQVLLEVSALHFYCTHYYGSIRVLVIRTGLVQYLSVEVSPTFVARLFPLSVLEPFVVVRAVPLSLFMPRPSLTHRELHSVLSRFSVTTHEFTSRVHSYSSSSVFIAIRD